MRIVRNYLRLVAAFFAVEILTGVFFPTLSFALTAGPTAPEFSSFEPVDMTDMVNLATGDFTYSLPVLEVPGPEGGYPMALAYHAGIQPDVEASWVGLGWTLSPGAINRTVNGYADDLKEARESVRDVWKGGETKSWTVGVGYGPFDANMSFSNDTYRGFGAGGGVGVGVPIKGPLNVGLSMGVNPYGDTYGTLGLGIGSSSRGVGVNMGVGLSYSSGSDNVTGYGSMGLSYSSKNSNFGISILGTSLNSKGTFSTSLAGAQAGSYNDFAGNVTSISSSWSVPIPVWNTGVVINIGKAYSRYYLDQTDHTYTYGALHPDHVIDKRPGQKTAFDSFQLLDIGSSAKIESNPNKDMGGSLPAVDIYSVTGQGIGGHIQPYFYEFSSIYRRDFDLNNYQDEDNVDDKDLLSFEHDDTKYQGKKVGFRFKNSFSNGFRRDLDLTSNTVVDLLEQDDNTTVGNSTTSGLSGKLEGFDRAKGVLAGGRNVEWFTNKEIKESQALGLMDYQHNRESFYEIDGQARSVEDQIGGFKVTNESGVTYHYALPVYNYFNYSYSQKKGGSTWRETRNVQPYAYTWLLTAITGPDFVDRGGGEGQANGVVDDNDWGYWVRFDYGKWTDQYAWRNPEEGMNRDIDNETESYAYGLKELYFLDAIRTRTHTALFVKSLRRDGKGVSNMSDGGFNVLTTSEGLITGVPTSTLKLDKIALYTNEELYERFRQSDMVFNLEGISALSDALEHEVTFANDQVPTTIHYGKNVISIEDLKVLGADVLDFSNRVVELSYTNELCNGTPNSLNINYKAPKASNNTSGKLTLKSLLVKGRNDVRVMPATTFAYKNTAGYDKDKKDIWGFYHSELGDAAGQKLSGQPTKLSAKDVDMWSLNKITTPLGAEINIDYESDTYASAPLTPFKNFKIENVTPVSQTPHLNPDEVAVKLKLGGSQTLNEFPELQPGQKIELSVVAYTIPQQGKGYYDCDTKGTVYEIFRDVDVSATIKRIEDGDNTEEEGGGTLIVESSDIFELITDHSTTVWTRFDEGNGQVECKWMGYPMNAYFLYGNAITNGIEEAYGGGLRVKSLKLKSSGRSFETNYSYDNGVTSFVPIGIDLDSKRVTGSGTGNEGWRQDALFIEQENYIFDKMKSVFAYKHFVPGPGVVYGDVKVSQSVSDINGTYDEGGKTEYKFLVMTDALKDKVMTKTQGKVVQDGTTSRNMKAITYRDISQWVGALKSVVVKDAFGNVLSKTENKYLHEQDDFDTELKNRFAGQGLINQSFYEKRLGKANKVDYAQLMITEKEEYPLVPLGKIEESNRGGFVAESWNLEFDYYTGVPTSVASKNIDGSYTIGVSVPAYHDYSGMGLGYHKSSNKNMLLQPGRQVTYRASSTVASPTKMSDFTKTGVLSASVNIWKDDLKEYYHEAEVTGTTSKVWRNKENYVWIGDDAQTLDVDGAYPFSAFIDFDRTNPQANTTWEKVNEVKKVDVFSNILEEVDNEGIASATLMDPSHRFVIATASNASYDELACSGAEFIEGSDLDEGKVRSNDGYPVKFFKHTGSYSLLVHKGKKGFSYTFKPDVTRKYYASVWAYLPGFADNDGTLQNIHLVCKDAQGMELAKAYRVEGQHHNNWYLIRMEIDPSDAVGDIEVTCENASAQRAVYFDDFRVCPVDAFMTAFVYDRHTTRTEFILDGDNLYTRYEYDDAGRLVRVTKEKFGINEHVLGEQKINYGR